MKPFEIAAAFMEQHARATAPAELRKVFARSLPELGIRYFLCGSHIDPLSARAAALVFHNYPSQWLREFSECGHFRGDPVFRYAEERIVPFFWDDTEFRDSLGSAQRNILCAAAAHGIEHGYTVPIHSPGARAASCSVVPGAPGFEPGAEQAVLIMAAFMFDSMLRTQARTECSRAPAVQLSERERQCLELAAQGKDDWAIGSLLCISERTAHNHIERAKRRLGVCTRVQVIVHALSAGQISFGDVIKAETQRVPGKLV